MNARQAIRAVILGIVVTTLGSLADAQAPKPASTPAATAAASAPPTDAEMIKSAMSAAPTAVSKHATIVAMEADGKMRTLRKGTNGFTCMPDNPATPGPDPMCMDADQSFYDQYPKAADPNTSAPYVMWAGTPYQHLMAPVK
jgi:hypothetical protein